MPLASELHGPLAGQIGGEPAQSPAVMAAHACRFRSLLLWFLMAHGALGFLRYRRARPCLGRSFSSPEIDGEKGTAM